MITLPVLHACVSCGTPIGSEKKRNWLSISSTNRRRVQADTEVCTDRPTEVFLCCPSGGPLE